MADPLLQDLCLDSVGKILRESREAQGISIENVSKILCINKRQLGKLESDPEGLICDVYNIGFLRSYAKLLNLDADALLQQFKAQNTSSPASHLIFPTPLSKKGMPSARILAISLLALVSVVVGYEWLRTRNPVAFKQGIPLVPKTSVDLSAPPSQEPLSLGSQENVKFEEVSPPSQELIQPVVQQEVLPISATEETSPKPLAGVSPALSSQSILLKVTEDSWIEVKDDQGNTIVSRLFHPEETYEFQNPQNLLLKTGNARGVHLIAGEKKLTFPGNQGEIKREISLNPEKWTD